MDAVQGAEESTLKKREINIYKYLMRRKCSRRRPSIIFVPVALFYLITDIITIMSSLIFG